MKNLIIRSLKKNEYFRWDNFVEENSRNALFYTTKWLLGIYEPFDVFVEIVVCVNNKDEILGGVVVAMKRKLLIFKVFQIPHLTPYYGIVLHEKFLHKGVKNESVRFSVINKLVSYIERNGVKINFNLSNEINDIRSFKWNKFNLNIVYTYVQNISDTQSVVDNFDSDVIRRIKKAHKLPFLIENGLNDQLISDFYRLQMMTCSRQNFDFPYQKRDFITILNRLGTKIVKIYSIKYLDETVFSQIVLLDKANAYYWLAAGNHDYYKTGLNQLLFKEMILDLADNKISYLDLVGANTPSVSKYKSSYNFDLLPYFNVSKTNSKLVTWLDKLRHN